MPKKPKSPIPIEQIDGMIRTIRGTRVMLDRDLAKNEIDSGFPRILCFG